MDELKTLMEEAGVSVESLIDSFSSEIYRNADTDKRDKTDPITGTQDNVPYLKYPDAPPDIEDIQTIHIDPLNASFASEIQRNADTDKRERIEPNTQDNAPGLKYTDGSLPVPNQLDSASKIQNPGELDIGAQIGGDESNLNNLYIKLGLPADPTPTPDGGSIQPPGQQEHQFIQGGVVGKTLQQPIQQPSLESSVCGDNVSQIIPQTVEALTSTTHLEAGPTVQPSTSTYPDSDPQPVNVEPMNPHLLFRAQSVAGAHSEGSEFPSFQVIDIIDTPTQTPFVCTIQKSGLSTFPKPGSSTSSPQLQGTSKTSGSGDNPPKLSCARKGKGKGKTTLGKKAMLALLYLLHHATDTMRVLSVKHKIIQVCDGGKTNAVIKRWGEEREMTTAPSWSSFTQAVSTSITNEDGYFLPPRVEGMHFPRQRVFRFGDQVSEKELMMD